MKNWQGLHKILTTFLTAVPQMGSLFVLTFLIMTIFALGMQMLGGQYSPANGLQSHAPVASAQIPTWRSFRTTTLTTLGQLFPPCSSYSRVEWIDATLRR